MAGSLAIADISSEPIDDGAPPAGLQLASLHPLRRIVRILDQEASDQAAWSGQLKGRVTQRTLATRGVVVLTWRGGTGWCAHDSVHGALRKATVNLVELARHEVAWTFDDAIAGRRVRERLARGGHDSENK